MGSVTVGAEVCIDTEVWTPQRNRVLRETFVKLKDYFFTQGRPYYDVKCEDSVEIIIKYVKLEYYAGIYIRQTI